MIENDLHPFGRPYVVVWYSNGPGKTIGTEVYGPFITPEVAEDWMGSFQEAIKKRPSMKAVLGMEVAVFERWFSDD